jgi:hypothetical protein
LQIAEDASLELDKFATNGVNAEQKRVVCRQEDLQPKPKPTEQVMLDGEFWRVVDVKTPFVHMVITLERMTC